MSLRVSYTGGQGCWHGALRDGSRLVWECSHAHVCRDNSMWGDAAQQCARKVREILEGGEQFIVERRAWTARYGGSPRLPGSNAAAVAFFEWAVGQAAEIRARSAGPAAAENSTCTAGPDGR